MITSTDKLKLYDYFNIVTSDPLDLSPLGFGTKRQRMKAWMKIRKEDDALNPMKTNKREDLVDEYEYLALKSDRLNLCIIALSRIDAQNSISVLEEYGIFGGDAQSKIARAVDQLKAVHSQMNEIAKELTDKKPVTKIDLLREMSVIAKHFPNISINSTLSEYRGAQRIYIDMVNEYKANETADN